MKNEICSNLKFCLKSLLDCFSSQFSFNMFENFYSIKILFKHLCKDNDLAFERIKSNFLRELLRQTWSETMDQKYVRT